MDNQVDVLVLDIAEPTQPTADIWMRGPGGAIVRVPAGSENIATIFRSCGYTEFAPEPDEQEREG